MNRRHFLTSTGAGLAALPLGCHPRQTHSTYSPPPIVEETPLIGPRPAYDGPNVILVRFGGGVRRHETVADPDKTWCPYVVKELGGKQGVLFDNVEIADAPGIATSHGQGTLYLLTGRYDRYEDVEKQPLADRFEAKTPTFFEYFRSRYDVPDHQTLIVNGEDRINEEFYTFSNHHQYGVSYRSTVLSLYRFKTYLLRKELKRDDLGDKERIAKSKQLEQMEKRDYRVQDGTVVSKELNAFWDDWQDYYGTSGLKNPRGDRVLTALALRAIQQLEPKLMMINYQDPDYVHWGNSSFYTRSISIIDEGIREIHSAVQAHPKYRDNTVFVVVPDCGRDANPLMSVPYQHHFNTKSAHEIFAVIAGPEKWVPHVKKTQTRLVQQVSVARTIGEIMRFPTPNAEPESLFKNV